VLKGDFVISKCFFFIINSIDNKFGILVGIKNL
jgi:hypothetical protein